MKTYCINFTGWTRCAVLVSASTASEAIRIAKQNFAQEGFDAVDEELACGYDAFEATELRGRHE